MSTIADLLIKVGAIGTDRAAKDLDNVGDRGSKSLGKIGKVAKTAALGLGTAAGVGLAWAAKTGWDEFQEGERVGAQTNAVLKSTGNIANVSADHISNLAGALLKKSGVDDDAIQSGENMLLTFTNIRNEVGKGNDIFDQTTKTLLDMSIATGQDMPKAAVMLGKAINDPLKGVGALSRVGVTFTEGQKKMIKSLMESGNVMAAQKIILGELNKEFGGSAEALGKTLPGQIEIAKNTLNNWLGELVGKAIPYIERFVASLRDHWPEIRAAFARFWGDAKPILEAFLSIAKSTYDFIRDNWTTIGPIVTTIGKIIESNIKTATSILKVFAALLRGDWSGAWRALKEAVGNALDGIKARIELMGAVGGALWKAMKALGGNLVGGVLNGLEGIGGKAWNVVNNIGSVIASFPGQISGWGKGVGSKVISGVVGGLDGIGGKAWNVINNIGGVISQYAGTIKGWGDNIGSWIVGGVKGAAKGIGSAIVGVIRSAINGVIDRINSLLTFHVSVDTHVPGVGKVGFGYTSHIPHLAKGTRHFAGGLAVVGERGPELVNLPTGSQVHTNAESKNMLGGDAGPEGDIVLVLDGEVLARFTRRELSRKGKRNVGLSFGGFGVAT